MKNNKSSRKEVILYALVAISIIANIFAILSIFWLHSFFLDIHNQQAKAIHKLEKRITCNQNPNNEICNLDK